MRVIVWTFYFVLITARKTRRPNVRQNVREKTETADAVAPAVRVFIFFVCYF